jgi:maltose alpha-D-glucosyltransferase / alpha-amylase
MDPVYGHQAVNVERQRRNPGSLLHWMRRVLAVRRQHPQLAVGSYDTIEVENRAVLAYSRGGVPGSDRPVLCVANLSRAAQPALVPLPGYEGWVPVELLGRVTFPPVGEGPYQITLPSHGWFWFELAPPPG